MNKMRTLNHCPVDRRLHRCIHMARWRGTHTVLRFHPRPSQPSAESTLGGPFERLGLDSLIVAGMLYVIVSGLKILAAYWLQNSR